MHPQQHALQPKQFLTNSDGKRVAVVLELAHYRKLLDAYEELECIHAFDEAAASGDEAIPFDQAIAEIEQGHRPRGLAPACRPLPRPLHHR